MAHVSAHHWCERLLWPVADRGVDAHVDASRCDLCGLRQRVLWRPGQRAQRGILDIRHRRSEEVLADLLLGDQRLRAGLLAHCALRKERLSELVLKDQGLPHSLPHVPRARRHLWRLLLPALAQGPGHQQELGRRCRGRQGRRRLRRTGHGRALCRLPQGRPQRQRPHRVLCDARHRSCVVPVLLLVRHNIPAARLVHAQVHQAPKHRDIRNQEAAQREKGRRRGARHLARLRPGVHPLCRRAPEPRGPVQRRHRLCAVPGPQLHLQRRGPRRSRGAQKASREPQRPRPRGNRTCARGHPRGQLRPHPRRVPGLQGRQAPRGAPQLAEHRILAHRDRRRCDRRSHGNLVCLDDLVPGHGAHRRLQRARGRNLGLPRHL
eukprot:comp21007_c0_seq1/m.44010 comp21007_c0_seq1/g.44010  ORF comp21007_c0_seq1/g.44010 comp21007_c0_seq1/m.44010 type:complete len:378 (+) comp21007_c0_seq1:111-1244(+)